MTQAAISHQVKALEAMLGVKLFRRLTRSLLLTDEGQALLPGLREGFDSIARAVGRVGQASGGGALTVSLMTTFALGWLVQRLPRFQAAHPDIDVRLTTTQRVIDFAREDVDVAIRYGVGQWPGLRTDKLFDDYLTPLCPPSMAPKLKTPADLKGLPLLTTTVGPDEWTSWLAAAGLTGFERTSGAAFDSTLIALQAAIQGVGSRSAIRISSRTTSRPGGWCSRSSWSSITARPIGSCRPRRRRTGRRCRRFAIGASRKRSRCAAASCAPPCLVRWRRLFAQIINQVERRRLRADLRQKPVRLAAVVGLVIEDMRQHEAHRRLLAFAGHVLVAQG